MDSSESLVADFLLSLGHTSVVYEPDGNIPPDFLVDERIAVEVRRLNQHHRRGDNFQGLEEVAIPLRDRIERLLSSLGPPTDGTSWFVSYMFKRPLERWKTLEPKLRAVLMTFKTSANHERCRLSIGNGFYLSISPASKPHATFYLLASYTDRDSGGWVLSEILKNLRICVDDKTGKIAAVRGKYPEWWLVLVDHIGRGLDEFDRAQFRQHVSAHSFPHQWQKIFLVDPLNHTRSFEV